MEIVSPSTTAPATWQDIIGMTCNVLVNDEHDYRRIILKCQYPPLPHRAAISFSSWVTLVWILGFTTGVLGLQWYVVLILWTFFWIWNNELALLGVEFEGRLLTPNLSSAIFVVILTVSLALVLHRHFGNPWPWFGGNDGGNNNAPVPYSPRNERVIRRLSRAIPGGLYSPTSSQATPTDSQHSGKGSQSSPTGSQHSGTDSQPNPTGSDHGSSDVAHTNSDSGIGDDLSSSNTSNEKDDGKPAKEAGKDENGRGRNASAITNLGSQNSLKSRPSNAKQDQNKTIDEKKTAEDKKAADEKYWTALKQATGKKQTEPDKA